MLKYIGKGFIAGIPARDLSDAEVKKHGGVKFLLETGLFEKPRSVPSRDRPEKKIKIKVVKKELIEEGE